MLEGYEALMPGSMERVFRMAEGHMEWAIESERRQLEADIAHREQVLDAQKQSRKMNTVSDLVGQVLGFAVAAGCVGGAIYCGMIGQPVVGVALVSVPVIGIIQAVRGMASKPKTPDSQKPSK